MSTYSQLLRIASVNKSGFVREKAVREIIKTRDIESLKFILFRLGDWVEPVRHTATGALRSFMKPEYISDFLNEISTIEWLLIVERVDLRVIQREIIEFMLSQEFSEDFFNQINILNNRARYWIFRNLLQKNHDPVYATYIYRFIQDKNFLIRLEILKQLASFDESVQRQIIKNYLQDQSPAVRVSALYASKKFAPEFDDTIVTMLSDNSISVRDLCRRLLQSKGFDFAGVYRDRISKMEYLEGSFMGLSEMARETDLELFEQHIYSNKAKIVVASLAAINKIDQQKAASYSFDLLAHSNNKVRNLAIEIVSKNFDRSALQRVREIYANGEKELKELLLRLFDKVGSWVAVYNFLLAVTDKNEDIQKLGWRCLEKWKAKTVRLFTSPPREEVERVNQQFKEIEQRNFGYHQKWFLQEIQSYFK
ncbi:hypothetical protein FAM09_15795 [Niastella caeni]|uniref:HEAT repeat domain-containing protein n=1 Tax=Niastella caeni TaxID=2569763 RepID=A0A4S8HS70_9BACT|nr:HEAT repeat domain-containing protein [Niastella caeni]THU38145.1 hypothetical protein FAM09_15795 [Niastella caeni]